jgi:ethylbenzene dioxygenase beta subunit
MEAPDGMNRDLPSRIELQHEIEQFLYREAALLEARKFEEWLALLTEDILYLVPNRRAGGEIAEDGVILRADLAALQAFVKRLTHPLSPPQRPLPRAIYVISNVIVGEEAGGELPVRSTVVAYVSAVDREPIHFPATCEYRLRRMGEDWKIACKTVSLLANNRPLGPLPLF